MGTKYVALDGIGEYRRERRHSSIEHQCNRRKWTFRVFYRCRSTPEDSLSQENQSNFESSQPEPGRKEDILGQAFILVHLCGRRAAPPEILVNATAGVRKECKYCENCNGKQSQKKTLRFTLALTWERDQGYVDLNESMPNWKWIGR